MNKNDSPTPPIDEVEALRQHRLEAEAERLALIRAGLAQILGEAGSEEIARRLREKGHDGDDLLWLYEFAHMTPLSTAPVER